MSKISVEFPEHSRGAYKVVVDGMTRGYIDDAGPGNWQLRFNDDQIDVRYFPSFEQAKAWVTKHAARIRIGRFPI